ncbi:hypothetical protein BGZ82_002877 [Podila clonocystis]|nr:hypothetical protein BGZ82_002877 [Podila clonocystis]
MKFTSIAVALVAYMAASTSAFSWGCEQEHFYGAKDIEVDIRKIESSWSKANPIRTTVSASGTWLKVTCAPRSDLSATPILQDCSNALDWLWNTVNDAGSDYLDKKGLVPRSCWVDNDSITVKWNNK